VVAWSSSGGNVALVSTAGLVTARRAGTVIISAAFAGLTGSMSLTVSAHALLSIVVTPVDPSVSAGSKLQFIATANYNDGTSQDISIFAHWSTSSANLATINSGQNGGGLATAKAPGSVTITAALNGVSGSTTLNIN
jgi:hypothetical protein